MRYWIRHDQPQLEGQPCYGWLDVPLAIPVEMTLAQLPNLPVHWPIYSSPLQRCLSLAQALAQQRQQAEPIRLSDLKEVNFGDWEGRQWHDIDRTALEEWAAAPYDYHFPGGESVPDFLQRIRSIIAQLPDEVIVVSHAGVIRAAWHIIQAKPLTEAFAYPVAYGECLYF